MPSALSALPAAEGAGAYIPLPEGSSRGCTHCGAPARYVRAPTTIDEALADRQRLCERCFRGLNPGNEGCSILDDPATWNPPEGDGQAAEPEPIPAVYVTPPEPDLPDLPQPDDLAGLDDAGVAAWIDRLCAAEAVRSPGTRYAVGLAPAALRAELPASSRHGPGTGMPGCRRGRGRVTLPGMRERTEHRPSGRRQSGWPARAMTLRVFTTGC
jgi:hypothetical protein